ncbi:hypothetical protein A9G48_00990 [Gilliamella sp. wkB18]|uniref:Aca2/YdiL-like domain-containing protein n=1 Tax=Gilliamella sp. wkB18 TaxID=3120260 RepID=UPI00080E5ECC|nr:DUF1870 family protein [Gilliamella apicola]OCG64976.1 hypothetical protein A9G48_00990 [Gilliamella apicola]
MNHTELKALRRFFFLDIVDAANLIAGVSARTWQRYEKGTVTIHKDVVEKINKLKQERKEILKKLSAGEVVNINVTAERNEQELTKILISSVSAELIAKS